MAKNLILGPILHPQIFLCGFYLYYMLDIVASYYHMEFQEKLMKQTWENGKKKLKFGPNFYPFSPKKCFVDFTSTRC